MYGEAFVWLIAAIMSGNRRNNKATRRQVNKYIDKQLTTMQDDFCVTYWPIEGSSSPASFAYPPHGSFSICIHFTFAVGVLVVIVDSYGCLVSARNKYEHHVNSLAMHSGTQTLTMISIIPHLEY